MDYRQKNQIIITFMTNIGIIECLWITDKNVSDWWKSTDRFLKSEKNSSLCLTFFQNRANLSAFHLTPSLMTYKWKLIESVGTGNRSKRPIIALDPKSQGFRSASETIGFSSLRIFVPTVLWLRFRLCLRFTLVPEAFVSSFL